MRVQIFLQSGLSEAVPTAVFGEMTIDTHTLRLSWVQPAGPDEKADTLCSLSYVPSTDQLSMTRTGDFHTDLIFSGRWKERTKGRLSTPHGDFEMDIETWELVVPSALWQMTDEEASVSHSGGREADIQLHYFLLLSGSEPVENHIMIRIRLEKNADTM